MQRLKDKRLTQKEAARILGISTRQVKRLWRAYRKKGAQGLVSGRRGKPSNNRLEAGVVQSALDLIKEKYEDFGPTLAHEKLTEVHGLRLSRESVRRIMIEERIWKPKKARKLIPHPLRERFTADSPIEIRPIDPTNPLAPKARPPKSAAWLRANGSLPDDPALHRYLLAYASDFNFLGTSLYPHGTSWLKREMQVASLDHAMWFHRPFRMDEWLLQVVESPSASGARGLVRAHFFTRDGRLVASTAQEGLIRRRG